MLKGSNYYLAPVESLEEVLINSLVTRSQLHEALMGIVRVKEETLNMFERLA